MRVTHVLMAAVGAGARVFPPVTSNVSGYESQEINLDYDSLHAHGLSVCVCVMMPQTNYISTN